MLTKEMSVDIKKLVEDSHNIAKETGWWDDGLAGPDGIIRPKTLYPTSIPDKRVSVEMVMTKLKLAAGELHEAGEELRADFSPTDLYWRDKETNLVVTVAGDLDMTNPEEMLANGYKPEGFGIEMADVFIRLADLCGLLGIDLDEMLRIKAAYNTKRPYRHGGKTV